MHLVEYEATALIVHERLEWSTATLHTATEALAVASYKMLLYPSKNPCPYPVLGSFISHTKGDVKESRRKAD